jgi:hypothetical protein
VDRKCLCQGLHWFLNIHFHFSSQCNVPQIIFDGLDWFFVSGADWIDDEPVVEMNFVFCQP